MGYYDPRRPLTKKEAFYAVCFAAILPFALATAKVCEWFRWAYEEARLEFRYHLRRFLKRASRLLRK